MARSYPPSPLTPLLLEGVRDTGRKVGKGAAATVKELNFRGLKCVGKVIHGALVDSANRVERAALLRRFEEECTLLSRLHHPCIVQFMGVFYEKYSDLPVLVMEYLHCNLSTCLETNGVLPEEISYQILRDVATGLRYLHEQPKPIIHRDLSANNVLLTTDMNAKISDLGVAKILDLTPAQVSQLQMTQAPGTPCYMPPEALMTKPNYTAKIDSYSYGVLMVHTLCGRWPYPTGAFRDDPKHPGTSIPVSEVGRREEYLIEIADKHPDLRDLIHRCLSNNPDNRPGASELLTLITTLHLKTPPSFSDRVQVMERLGILEAKNEYLTKENRTLATKKEEMQATIESQDAKIDLLQTDLQRNRSVSMPESLYHPQQPHLFDPQAKLKWRECADIPIGLTGAQAVVIQHQVYIGGSVAGNKRDLHLVFRYDPKQDTWELLSACPVRFFGMSHFKENLVTVGGKHQDGSITGKVYRYVIKDNVWKEFLQPMQIPRAAPSVVSTSTALVACGGAQGSDPLGCTFVEVFSAATSQWHLTDPLPMPCHFMSVAMISDRCYLLGGRGGAENDDINSVFCAPISSLLHNAAPKSRPRTSTVTVWEKLADTPLKRSTAASLSGCLLAMGGYDNKKSQAIHVYLPCTSSWVRMWNCDLPERRWGCTAVQLDFNKVLVISGRDNQDMRTNTVIEGVIYV